MDSLLNQFGNREIASLIWVVGILILLLIKRSYRESIAGLLKVFSQWILIRVFIIAIFYVLLIVYLLYWRDIWTFENLKSTIIWTFTFAFVSVAKANQMQEDRLYFTKVLREIIAITAFFIFIIELHSFSLLVELIALPTITVVVIMHTLSETKKEYSQANNLFNLILSIVGLIYLAVSMWKTFDNFESLATIDTLREFLIPILLSILFLPFMFLLGIYMAYENAFVSMRNWFNDRALLSYAKRQALIKCRFNLDYLNRWNRHIQSKCPDTKSGLNQSFNYIKTILDREKNPPDIPIERGWSPWIAKDFMEGFELKTRDYHESFDNEWIAGSNFREIGEDFFNNNLAYYLEGTADYAKQLKLKLNINKPEFDLEAKSLMCDSILYLIDKAIPETLPNSLLQKVKSMENFDERFSFYRLNLRRNDWTGGLQGGYDLKFSISLV